MNIFYGQFGLDFHTGIQDFQGVIYESIGMSLLEFQRTEG